MEASRQIGDQGCYTYVGLTSRVKVNFTKGPHNYCNEGNLLDVCDKKNVCGCIRN